MRRTDLLILYPVDTLISKPRFMTNFIEKINTFKDNLHIATSVCIMDFDFDLF